MLIKFCFSKISVLFLVFSLSLSFADTLRAETPAEVIKEEEKADKPVKLNRVIREQEAVEASEPGKNQTEMTFYRYMEDEGDFVRFPAGVGRAAVGGVFELAGIPLSLTWGIFAFPFAGEPKFYDYVNDSFWSYSDFNEQYISYIGYYAVGVPFMTVKKCIWDFPVFLMESAFASDPPPESEKNDIK